ncbi:tRNA dihydrouridine synthase [Desulfatibacillum aliphaticivorans]|uniref:tRNA dihydrouridine synthase n=1 Tax=Desulfatibacillum aliphaticivorans TaxID=218208 RepID=UPI00031AF0B2|nr:tRNA-dihydrouridine synthase family protein [Desulfatibacillum aliphaticivorans]
MKTDLKIFLNSPLAIGGKTIANRLILAPMAGLTHIAFREVMALYGGYGLLYTGMAGAKSVPHENPKVSTVFSWREKELDHTVCQIFGSVPETMAKAAERIEAEGFFGVDINCGCSARAICRFDSGAALLAKPDLAAQVVRAVRKAVNIPVIVKFRTGWKDDPAHAVSMARLFCDEGADALIFHPRVAPDLRTRPPKWEYIGLVKDAVKVPVFGNGNVISLDDAAKMLSMSGCDGVALGRIALAQPWIMAQWSQGMKPALEDYKTAGAAMASFCAKRFEPRTAFLRFMKFSPYYCANFQFGHALHKRLFAAKEIDNIIPVLENFFQSDPPLNKRPTPGLFV